MAKQITLTISDEILRKAEGLATLMDRPIEEVLVDVIQVSLPDLGTMSSLPINHLPDEELLTLAQAKMQEPQNKRLSELLDKRQSRFLSGIEQSELTSLFQIYLRLWLSQSEAMVEAVRRGLMKPLSV